MASGEMSEPEFTRFLSTTLGLAVNASRDGALHFVCMDWRHLFELLSAGRVLYDGLLNLCVWNKDNGGMGSFYRSKHELVAVFKVGSVPHVNNVELGRHGRNRTNVWDYAGVNAFKAGRLDELAIHPTSNQLRSSLTFSDASRRCDLTSIHSPAAAGVYLPEKLVARLCWSRSSLCGRDCSTLAIIRRRLRFLLPPGLRLKGSPSKTNWSQSPSPTPADPAAR
jgi:hypothetical protein